MESKIGHSIKALSNILGNALAPLLWRGWGRLMVLAVLLLGATGYSYAQVNTAEEPYLNSWHKYAVTMGFNDPGNTYRWNIYNNIDDANNDLAESSPNRFLLDGEGWIQNQTLVGSEASIEIYFDETIFADGSSWYLVFSEISGSTGACVARRLFNITIRDNNFYFTLPTDDSQCNSLGGDLLDGDAVAAKMTSSVDFTFTMNKSADHLVDNWSVNGQITLSGAASYLATDVTFEASGLSSPQTENWVLTDNGNGSFSLSLDCDPDDATYTSDNVTVRVYIFGLVTDDVSVNLELSDGKAYSGSTFVIVTDDNLNKASGDRDQSILIHGLPGNQNISENY